VLLEAWGSWSRAEPVHTPAKELGVEEAGVDLRYIAQARDRGVAVMVIAHNLHHAYPIGDCFTVLNRGHSWGAFRNSEISREQVVNMMAGGEELEELGAELEEFARTDRLAAERQAAREMLESAGN
jgi:simple sugar transport system ATP-binding protein